MRAITAVVLVLCLTAVLAKTAMAADDADADKPVAKKEEKKDDADKDDDKKDAPAAKKEEADKDDDKKDAPAKKDDAKDDDKKDDAVPAKKAEKKDDAKDDAKDDDKKDEDAPKKSARRLPKKIVKEEDDDKKDDKKPEEKKDEAPAKKDDDKKDAPAKKEEKKDDADKDDDKKDAPAKKEEAVPAKKEEPAKVPEVKPVEFVVPKPLVAEPVAEPVEGDNADDERKNVIEDVQEGPMLPAREIMAQPLINGQKPAPNNNNAVVVRSLLQACRTDIPTVCPQRKALVKCLSKNVAKITNPVCKTWVNARDVCIKAAAKSTKCVKKDSPRQCLRKIPAEELPADCTSSDFYKSVKMFSMFRRNQKAGFLNRMIAK